MEEKQKKHLYGRTPKEEKVGQFPYNNVLKCPTVAFFECTCMGCNSCTIIVYSL